MHNKMSSVILPPTVIFHLHYPQYNSSAELTVGLGWVMFVVMWLWAAAEMNDVGSSTPERSLEPLEAFHPCTHTHHGLWGETIGEKL